MTYFSQSIAGLLGLSKKSLAWLSTVILGVVATGITGVFTDISKPIFDKISGTTCNIIHLLNCSPTVLEERPFTPVAFAANNIPFKPANADYRIFVFYRSDRRGDAENIVGALKAAGYQCDDAESDLNETITPNRNPGTTLIKATATGRSTLDDVQQLIHRARPVAAPPLLFAEDAPLLRGDIQIDLF
jgi:hypothetical protein